jgi:hypothetical protein
MKSGIRRGIAAIAAAAVLVLPQASVSVAASAAPVAGGPSGSNACSMQAAAARSAGTIAALRTFGDCEVGRRMTTLGQLTAFIDASRALTAADKTTLAAQLGATSSGLAALEAEIDAGVSVAVLKARVVEIATQFRVYDVVAPQVYLTNAADGVAAVAAQFENISTELAGRISTAKSAGKDTTAAEAALEAMKVAIATAATSASPLPARLLALTPAQFNAGTAGPELGSARASILSARDQLKSAVADARAVLADLR